MQGESNTTDIAEDHQSLSPTAICICAAGSDEPFKPLNLTYSLVKELRIAFGKQNSPHFPNPAERG